jgi:hypothetical protein
MEAIFPRVVGPRRDVSDVRKLRERNYLNEGQDEPKEKEPEDVNVKLVNVNHVSVLSVHLDEASNLSLKFDFKIIFIINNNDKSFYRRSVFQ